MPDNVIIANNLQIIVKRASGKKLFNACKFLRILYGNKRY